MKKISVAIATFNEEVNLKLCLKSVVDWVDEIIVVDGTSTDKTVEVAKSYKAKVIITSNQTNFHRNKQKAIEICSGEWILQLDADEVVTQELKTEIVDLLDQPVKKSGSLITDGYWIPRKNHFLGRFLTKGGQYPDYTLRLYRNGKGRLPCKSVHEQAEVKGKIDYLKNPLLHFPYPDFSHYLEHFNLYTTILAEELQENKIAVNVFSFLNFMILKPSYWFLLTFLRHKGFQDGFPGFTFSLFSSLRFPVAYIKYWERENNAR